MGAAEHLKTLCCLGLTPESAMVAVTPLLHETIPHGWSRMGLYEPDATMGSSVYAENPAMALYLEPFWGFLNDPSDIIGSIYLPNFRATGIGWALHRQGRGYLDGAWYREIEAPLDSCWWLDANIGDAGQTIAAVHLTRPRSTSPFTAYDVQSLDRLRPWLAHAFRRVPSSNARKEDQDVARVAGAPVLSGQIILTPGATVVFQTPSLEHLLIILAGEPGNYTRYVPPRDTLPAPILKLLRSIIGATNGDSNTPPRTQISTSHGVIALEAKWLVPAGAMPADVARDPKSCLISVTVELREHAIAHAARILRESGATPAQVKVGVHLALGKGKPAIAEDLGIKVSSVRDLTEKIYQTFDVHNSTELATKIWLSAG
jgi:DNA-binding CsgD family transcriptional regulator